MTLGCGGPVQPRAKAHGKHLVQRFASAGTRSPSPLGPCTKAVTITAGMPCEVWGLALHARGCGLPGMALDEASCDMCYAVRSGKGLSSEELVEVVAKESAGAIRFLQGLGLNLSSIQQLGGHSVSCSSLPHSLAHPRLTPVHLLALHMNASPRHFLQGLTSSFTALGTLGCSLLVSLHSTLRGIPLINPCST